MDVTLAELEQAKQLIADFRKKVEFFIERLWSEIRHRCRGQESFNLLKAKVEGTWKLTRLEEADLVLEELCRLIDVQEEYSSSRIEELQLELEALRNHNSRLKREIQENLREAEILDRENESLRKSVSGEGATSVRKFVCSSLQEANEHIVELQGKLRLAQQERVLEVGELYHKVPELQHRVVMSSQDILKTVKALVPTFGGEESPSLQTEVYKFVDGCRLAARGVPSEKIEEYLEVVKQRLYGDAYQLVRLRSFTSVEGLVAVIKTTYLKTRSLDSVLRELYEACQKRDEDIRQFARRLRTLEATAQQIIKDSYNGRSDGIMKFEIERKMKAAFTSGLRDPMIRGRMLASSACGLDELLDEALGAQATLWRGDDAPSRSVNFSEEYTLQEAPMNRGAAGIDPVAGLVAAVEQLLRKTEGKSPVHTGETGTLSRSPCSFCDKVGHTRDVCWERKNSPYCVQCRQYGHEEGRTCHKSDARGQERKNIRCYRCGNEGHISSQCAQNFSGGGQSNRPRQPQIMCYRCGNTGHMSAQCSRGNCMSGNGPDHRLGQTKN